MTVDLSPILSQFTAFDVVVPVLSVAGTIAGILMVLYAAIRILQLLRGGDVTVQDDMRHVLNWFNQHSKNHEFKKRYAREIRHNQYRDWKKKRGYK
ncbi:hypothetical protein ACO0K7_18980 [Undibacterium sp. Ji67W]|uniref:hypothetical protein n=1 Tax=Undibacterium sp. Ji67W TaxID=3413042 RepID=UPI003BEFF46F